MTDIFSLDMNESIDFLVKHLPESIYTSLNVTWSKIMSGEPDSEVVTTVLISLIIPAVIILIISWNLGTKVKEKIPDQIKNKINAARDFVVPPEGPRFRKRDKIAFIGQRMVKKVKAAGSYIRGGQGRKRKAIAKFAKRLLGQQISPEIGHKFKLPLPLEYLEEDFDGGHEILPQQLKFVLQNMRVFGHFEQPIFLEIVKQIEYMSVPANQYLFQVKQVNIIMKQYCKIWIEKKWRNLSKYYDWQDPMW